MLTRFLSVKPLNYFNQPYTPGVEPYYTKHYERRFRIPMAKDIYEEIVETQGGHIQWGYVQEECAELIAIIHQHIIRGRKTYDDLVEELVDVEIMLKIAKVIVDQKDPNIWEKWQINKVRKMAKQLNLGERYAQESGSEN